MNASSREFIVELALAHAADDLERSACPAFVVGDLGVE